MASTNVEFTCFVRGLDQDTDEKDLTKIFSKFGNVNDSKVRYILSFYDHVTGKSRRFGFVTFDKESSMRDAIKEMNSQSRKKNWFQCFVHGLDCGTDSNALKSEFSAFGEVIDSQVIYDTETGSSRGFGFVTFKDKQSMEDAIMLMDGDEIDGSQINVEESRNKCVRSITVEEARPRRLSRLNRSTEFALEFVRLLKEKEKKMAGL